MNRHLSRSFNPSAPRHFAVYDGLMQVGGIEETAEGFDVIAQDGQFLGSFSRLQAAVRAIPTGANANSRPRRTRGAPARLAAGGTG